MTSEALLCNRWRAKRPIALPACSFDFVYPGIGARMGAPDRLNEIWYQSFNQMDMAPALVGASRETCRAYISYFLRHWAYRNDAFDDVLDTFIDNFLKPGNLAGGFAHYRASHAGRIAMMKGEAASLPRITVPTCVRWAVDSGTDRFVLLGGVVGFRAPRERIIGNVRIRILQRCDPSVDAQCGGYSRPARDGAHHFD